MLMRTKDLVKMLRARFGEVSFITIRFFKVGVHWDKDITELDGVLEVVADNKLICGGSVVHAECDFLNAVYSTLPGYAVLSALEHHPLIYMRFRKNNVNQYVYVPCRFTNVDISKFEPVTEISPNKGVCPFENTDKCPLHRAYHEHG
jgi:hypothetical protein